MTEVIDIGKLHADRIGAGLGICRQPFEDLINRFFGSGVAARNWNKR